MYQIIHLIYEQLLRLQIVILLFVCLSFSPLSLRNLFKHLHYLTVITQFQRLSLSLSLSSCHNSHNSTIVIIYITDSHNTMSNHLLSVSTFGLFLLLLGGSAYGLFITHRPFSPDLISDGVHDRDSSWGSYLVQNRLSAESSTSTCDQTYGFLPCTTSVMGNLFLTVVYGYLMFFASKSLSDGCELLFEILEPGIVVGLLLPILRALSDAIIVLGAHSFLLLLLFFSYSRRVLLLLLFFFIFYFYL